MRPRRQGGRLRAVFRDRAGAGMGATQLSGQLAVVGLGPGDERWLTPEADSRARCRGSRLRLRPVSRPRSRARKVRSATPPTIARSAHAPLRRCGHAARGAKVAIVSGGDPGVFAMAAAVCAEIEAGPEAWRALDLVIVPGVTAMLAVAARVGAPLGHDFCAMSLSDNLKPWELIERRLDAAASAGFVIALYNPISRARPWQLGTALERLRRHLPRCDAGGVRPRRRARGRAHCRHGAREMPSRRMPTWRRSSSWARARRARSRGRAARRSSTRRARRPRRAHDRAAPARPRRFPLHRRASAAARSMMTGRPSRRAAAILP